MRVQEAVSALRGVGLRPARIEPIPGGWAFWTFDIDDADGAWIARFPRNEDVASERPDRPASDIRLAA